MKKRLIIELEDDDFRSILGALLKTRADFTVETISVEEKPARTLQRKTDDGLSASEVLLNFIAEKHRIKKDEVPPLVAANGFKAQTGHATASRLCLQGLIKRDGIYYTAAQGRVA